MNFKDLYLRMDGRISRSTLWLKYYLPFMGIAIIAALADFGLGTFDEETGWGVFGLLATLILFYPSIAVFVKRSHDRGRSGLFVLLMFVPLVNIWPAIELYFLKGTDGDNDYGSDPTAG